MLGHMCARTSAEDATAPFNTVQWFTDNVYVDNTAARVMICQNADGSGKREIQIIYDWNGTTNISFTVRDGKFTSGEQGYIVVYDEDNNIASYPIEFGEPEAPEESPR